VPPITPQPPWHGYSLGDWDDQYDVYARRAVEGRWAESGSETIERRRAGLIPETPVRGVETPKKKS
jgi:4-hydroxy-3-polyprenylbenzoate decarboxylase